MDNPKNPTVIERTPIAVNRRKMVCRVQYQMLRRWWSVWEPQYVLYSTRYYCNEGSSVGPLPYINSSECRPCIITIADLLTAEHHSPCIGACQGKLIELTEDQDRMTPDFTVHTVVTYYRTLSSSPNVRDESTKQTEKHSTVSGFEHGPHRVFQ